MMVKNRLSRVQPTVSSADPGDDPFEHISLGNELHLFLFSDKETLRWKDWILLKREAGKEYRSYIDF